MKSRLSALYEAIRRLLTDHFRSLAGDGIIRLGVGGLRVGVRAESGPSAWGSESRRLSAGRARDVTARRP